MSGALRLFNIPSAHAFVDALAMGLLERFGAEPLTLSRVTVLLPTRRAGRALREALLRASGGRPLLLPGMRAIGDVDEDELAFDPLEGEDGLELPPAIAPLRRQLLLSALIRRRDPAIDAAQAAQLAAELARLLDHLQTEDLGLDALVGVAPDALARHWQTTIEFLGVLAEPWRGLLAAEGALDPAARRARLLRALAARWRERPPEDPVIAAGSTGSIPATAELLGVVARLPAGMVVLPGLDAAMDEASWAALGPTHPQFGLKQLLERVGSERSAVAPWPVSPTPPARLARMRLVSEAMRPVETTPAWRDLRDFPKDALEGVARVDLPGAPEEAGAIALLLRETLETPGATAALVTPDRALARRVAAELRRWDVEIDDSAGEPLGATPPGALLRLAAEALADELAPAALLALLKHPLVQAGSPERFRAEVRRLELRVLRGPRPGPGFRGLLSAAQAARNDAEEAAAFVARLAALSARFAGLVAQPLAALPDLLDEHVRFVEALTAGADGAPRIWDGEAGEGCAVFVAELREAAADTPPVEGRAYAALFAELMRSATLRPAWGRHPRLHIWGPLEARLQHADLVVLGGLNEGSWPKEASPDPWLSRPIRLQLGLPAPERRVGLAAHDFAQAAAAERIVLTRAEKVEGSPTVASRWLLRLDAAMDAAGLCWPARRAADLRAWQAGLDAAAGEPPRLRAPEFAPPVEARPRRLSVTQIESWMRDPYAIYARHVLRLRALDPLDADPGAADRGLAIHAALDAFLRAYPAALPDDAYPRLLEFGRAAFGAALERPGVRAFWEPRFERIARWFVEFERARRREWRTLATEVSGSAMLPGPAGPFELTATADRIDIGLDGRLAVIDYKTGAPPKRDDVLSGYAPQLPLEAVIAQAGGFPQTPAAEVATLEFWRLAGGWRAAEIASFAADGAASAARDGLVRLIARFDDPATPYRARPRPDAAPRYSDYEHLERLREWSSSGGDEE